MRLQTPKTVSLPFRREFPGLEYLADGQTPYISADVKPGGHLNQALMEEMDRLRLQRNVALMGVEKGQKGASEAFVKANDTATRDYGRGQIIAVYRHCVAGWETNIIDAETNAPVAPTEDNFMFLASVRIAEIGDYYLGLVGFVHDVARFIAEDDKATEKN